MEKGLQILNLGDYKGNAFNRNRQLEMVFFNCKKLSSWKYDQEKLNGKNNYKLHKLYV